MLNTVWTKELILIIVIWSMTVYTRFNPGMNIWCSVFTFANQISIRTLVQSIMDLVNSKLHVASNIGLEFRKVVLNHILIHANTNVTINRLALLALRRLYVRICG